MKDEATIQAEIVEGLERMGRLVIRIQSGKVKVRRGWMQLAPKGTPDLFVVGHGFLETKTTAGKLSAAQVAMHENIRRHGDAVYVVRTAKEARKACRGV